MTDQRHNTNFADPAPDELIFRTGRAALGPYRPAVEAALEEIRAADVVRRIWSGDHSLWQDDPAGVADRLGWLHSPAVMTSSLAQIREFVESVRADGIRRIVLLGMGGSSLAAEVFRRVFGVGEGCPDLAVLDSTDPDVVAGTGRDLDPARTLFIVATKSGGTVETLSFMKHFFHLAAETLGQRKAGRHFAAITDPGSGLEKLARSLAFRNIFLNDPHIGGRYSALSLFGLVPAALIGLAPARILARARAAADDSRQTDKPGLDRNRGVWLGAALGELALAGRDKLTLVMSPPLAPFGVWVEQLVAESTGKNGRGILPVTGEALLDAEHYGGDRLFVYLRLKGDRTWDRPLGRLRTAGHPVVQLDLQELEDLYGEFFCWEIATAVAGRRLGINPFDQPDVESAKVLARTMIAAFEREGRLPEAAPDYQSDDVNVFAPFRPAGPREALLGFLDLARPQETPSAGRSYIALQAFVPPDPGIDRALQRLRSGIQRRCRLAVTTGYGPRYLHSTGQLHKGDAGRGLFIQITCGAAADLPIPDTPRGGTGRLTFGVLKDAQALGDYQALQKAGRRVMRFHFEGDVARHLRQLAQALEGTEGGR